MSFTEGINDTWQTIGPRVKHCSNSTDWQSTQDASVQYDPHLKVHRKLFSCMVHTERRHRRDEAVWRSSNWFHRWLTASLALHSHSMAKCTNLPDYVKAIVSHLPFTTKLCKTIKTNANTRECSFAICGWFSDLCSHQGTMWKRSTLKFFKYLAAEGHRASLSKLKFVKEEISFLGHIIAAKGRSLVPKHIEAIQNIPKPVTKKQVKSFYRDVYLLSH